MKRYNLLDGEVYGKRYQMVEETNGDYVWFEDVEDRLKKLEGMNAELLRALETLTQDLINGAVWSETKNKARAAIAKAKGEAP